MKNILFLLSLCLGITGYGQYHRFVYEYTYAPDSLQADQLQTENMVLDIGPKGSEFMSWKKKVRDSLIMQNAGNIMNLVALGKNNPSSADPGNLTYFVEKQYENDKVYIYEMLLTDRYKISDDRKPVWKILPDKKKINGYDVQKATTTLGGRTWTAWFTQQIPFQDGPYTFRGLPGLIVSVEDQTHTHRMNLVANQKLNEISKKEVPGFQPYQNEISVSKKQFGKAWKE